jgi:hypothetical protein
LRPVNLVNWLPLMFADGDVPALNPTGFTWFPSRLEQFFVDRYMMVGFYASSIIFIPRMHHRPRNLVRRKSEGTCFRKWKRWCPYVFASAVPSIPPVPCSERGQSESLNYKPVQDDRRCLRSSHLSLTSPLCFYIPPYRHQLAQISSQQRGRNCKPPKKKSGDSPPRQFEAHLSHHFHFPSVPPPFTHRIATATFSSLPLRKSSAVPKAENKTKYRARVGVAHRLTSRALRRRQA